MKSSISSGTESSAASLPILDIRQYHTDRPAFVEALRNACHTVGFFLLRHDIFPADLPQRQLQETQCFFAQSMDAKLTISYENSPAFRGYMPLGSENTSGQTDLREQVEFAVETTTTTDEKRWPPYERLRGSNPWPDAIQPTLKLVTSEYVEQVCRIAKCIQQSLCAALGLEESYLDSIFEQGNKDDPPHWVLKLVSYPPVLLDDDNDATDDSNNSKSIIRFGVGAHTDTNFLTLILQDDVGGLQVWMNNDNDRKKNDSKGIRNDTYWMNVPCSGDGNNEYLVVNLGEQAELFSRGYFRATPHRVLANTTTANTSKKQNRVSVPLFYNPALSATIQPIPESVLMKLDAVDDDQTSCWRAGNKPNKMLSGVGENTFKSLARSHPHVFAVHHADLRLLQDGRIVAVADITTADNVAAKSTPSNDDNSDNNESNAYNNVAG